MLSAAREKGVVTQDESELVRIAVEACKDAIEVDSFALEEYKKGIVNAVGQSGSQDDDGLAPVSNA